MRRYGNPDFSSIEPRPSPSLKSPDCPARVRRLSFMSHERSGHHRRRALSSTMTKFQDPENKLPSYLLSNRVLLGRSLILTVSNLDNNLLSSQLCLRFFQAEWTSANSLSLFYHLHLLRLALGGLSTCLTMCCLGLRSTYLYTMSFA